MMTTIDKVQQSLNIAWQEIEHGINIAYDDGYSALIWKMKQIQLQIENLEVEINEKEYGDVDDDE